MLSREQFLNQGYQLHMSMDYIKDNPYQTELEAEMKNEFKRDLKFRLERATAPDFLVLLSVPGVYGGYDTQSYIYFSKLTSTCGTAFLYQLSGRETYYPHVMKYALYLANTLCFSAIMYISTNQQHAINEALTDAGFEMIGNSYENKRTRNIIYTWIKYLNP